MNDYNTFKEIAKERIVIVCDDISKHQKKMKGKCNLQEIEKIRKTVLGSKVDKTTLDEYYNNYSVFISYYFFYYYYHLFI